MSKATQPIPPGFSTLTPHLIIKDTAKAIDFYKKAFGAEELVRMPMPDGRVEKPGNGCIERGAPPSKRICIVVKPPRSASGPVSVRGRWGRVTAPTSRGPLNNRIAWAPGVVIVVPPPAALK